MFDQNMAQNFDFDSNIVGNNNVIDNEVDINMMNYGGNQGMQGMPMMSGGCCSNPISEGVQEKCVHRTFVHEVPQECQFLID